LYLSKGTDSNAGTITACPVRWRNVTPTKISTRSHAMSCIHLDAPQGSTEWFAGRLGAITASMATECRKTLKSGANKGDYSQKARDYGFKLAVERISGELLDDPQFDPWQAKRGRELEPEARLAYEETMAVLVEQTGLALTEDRLFGAS